MTIEPAKLAPYITQLIDATAPTKFHNLADRMTYQRWLLQSVLTFYTTDSVELVLTVIGPILSQRLPS